MMKKLLVLGMAAMMTLNCVGCGKEETTVETESFIKRIEVENIEVENIEVEEIIYECETHTLSDELLEDLAEIFNVEEIDESKLELYDDGSASYDGVFRSAEYISEVMFNSQTNVYVTGESLSTSKY